jgi:hypothetical protein
MLISLGTPLRPTLASDGVYRLAETDELSDKLVLLLLLVLVLLLALVLALVLC